LPALVAAKTVGTGAAAAAATISSANLVAALGDAIIALTVRVAPGAEAAVAAHAATSVGTAFLVVTGGETGFCCAKEVIAAGFALGAFAAGSAATVAAAEFVHTAGLAWAAATLDGVFARGIYAHTAAAVPVVVGFPAAGPGLGTVR
jgi:hypothetical protein